MRHRFAFLSAAAVLFATPSAWAQCSVSSDAGAVAKPVDASVQADADLIVSMSMMPKLMHIDYANAAKQKPACDLGAFDTGSTSYQLYGDDKAGRLRIAQPALKGGPIARIVAVTNILKAIEASKQGRPAPVEGYLLATMTKAEFIGWKYYTGLPDPATLKRDMAEALKGGTTPIFRNGADGKTAIFVPKG